MICEQWAASKIPRISSSDKGFFQCSKYLFQNTHPFNAWDKCSGLVHWEDPEESGGEGGGRGDRDGEYM